MNNKKIKKDEGKEREKQKKEREKRDKKTLIDALSKPYQKLCESRDNGNKKEGDNEKGWPVFGS